MAQTITVAAEIDSRGARVGANQFNSALRSMRSGVASTGRAVTSLAGQFFSLRGALVSIAGVLSGRELVAAADNYSLLQSRLALVAQEGTTVESLFGGIADAANRANRPVSDLTELYTRNSHSLAQMGRSQEDGIRLAENLAKALTISGTSATEAAGGLRQLSQAIAAGAFRGDEFNSVAENIPEVMRILQRETGKTVGELRKLAAEGKLTSEVLVNSLLNASQDIDRKFEGIEQTATQSFTVMADQARITWGEIADDRGVSNAWAEAFSKIREAMAGPAFRDGARFTADTLVSIANLVRDTAANVDELRIQWNAWTTAISETTAYKVAAAGIGLIGDAINYLDRQITAADNALNTFFGNVDTGIAERTAQLAEQQRSFEAMRKLTVVPAETPLQATPASAARLPIEFGSGVDEQAQKRAEKLIARAKERLEIERLRNSLSEAEIAGDTVKIAALENQLAVQRASNDELRKVSPELASQLEAQARLNEELERQKGLVETARELGEDFGRTLTDGLISAAKEGKNLGESLRGVAAQMLEMLAKAAIINPMITSLGNSFGKAFGGFDFSSITSSFMPMASGGVIGSPVAFAGAGGVRGVIGEAGPEAVVPLRRGANGRLGIDASGFGGGGSVTNVNINIEGDATDATVERMRRVAEQVFTQREPGTVDRSVEAVRVRNHRDRAYLAR